MDSTVSHSADLLGEDSPQGKDRNGRTRHEITQSMESERRRTVAADFSHGIDRRDDDVVGTASEGPFELALIVDRGPQDLLRCQDRSSRLQRERPGAQMDAAELGSAGDVHPVVDQHAAIPGWQEPARTGSEIQDIAGKGELLPQLKPSQTGSHTASQSLVEGLTEPPPRTDPEEGRKHGSGGLVFEMEAQVAEQFLEVLDQDTLLEPQAVSIREGVAKLLDPLVRP